MRPYVDKEIPELHLDHRLKSHDYPSHYHQNVEIVYCLSGKQNVLVGDETLTLHAGEACIVFPYMVHGYQSVPDCPQTEISIVVCDATILTNVIPDIFSKHPKTPHLLANQLPDDIGALFRCIHKSKDNMERFGYTYLIMSRLFENLEFIDSNMDPHIATVITSYIDTNFQEPLTIELIAKKMGYHPSYIAHIFCDWLKIPFRTYLNTVRCDHAVELMRTTRKSLTEIAYESGFASLNTFGRAFKKLYSQTPSQYKKNLK